MESLNRVWPLPGRLMLAIGLAGFGLTNLTFSAPLDGLQLIPPGTDVVMTSRATGVLWLATATGLFIPPLVRPAQIVGVMLCVLLLVSWVLLAFIAEVWPPVVGWVSMAELWGISAGVASVRPWNAESRRSNRVIVGGMLILFGFVHWIYVGAITGMIPEWIPGRQIWPLFTGAANVLAGIAIASGVFSRPASALVGTMFASWILLVHLPRLLAAPGDKAEWVGLALAFALTGTVWTIHRALAPSGEDLQPSAR